MTPSNDFIHTNGITNNSNKEQLIKVVSDNIKYEEEYILSKYTYRTTTVEKDLNTDNFIVKPKEEVYEFKTDKNIGKVGLMLVGWGGNNGSTLTASLFANKNNICWNNKEGLKKPNYFGSLLLASTTKLGVDSMGKDIYVPMNKLVPMLDPNELIIGGWDINNFNLYDAMKRAKVLDYDLQIKLKEEMEKLKPLPSIYYPEYIALNQKERANNILDGNKKQHLDHIRNDIKKFKADNNLDKVIVLWTANTERFSDIIKGVNDTKDNILKSIDEDHSEISPSNIFAIASILEGCSFINGSPQNTFVPGIIELAEQEKVYIGGDDFKSGQTKIKSVLVDFLVNAGIKPIAITSYNHLGNNDGLNLNENAQFKSKEISKSSVVDDMVKSNNILYKKGEKPDHTVVIKYVPTVGDSKRALDEYVSEIFMNGLNTISIYNTCEDSLLATPLIIDLVMLTELFNRIEYRTKDHEEFKKFNSILSILSYMLKAPLVPKKAPVVNSLNKQRLAIENILRACLSLDPMNDLMLEHRI